ncbi:free fatty acid receptor 4-like isoform X2 [Thunnus maccoyii]|uniref:free fatty acid receptor 4-like isoform X2 n=1 Tax=Thunnus maccoyii TaxID=8240 RepID=UPI001C4D5888|nr:free fatty acid receptor 4-like isoform X2 [Thunnus maccoyii]
MGNSTVCTSNEQLSTSNVVELQNHLRDSPKALETNKQWLEYDQQREAYARALLDRMLWLKKQLNEANQARSQQHNKDYSDEEHGISQMQEYCEGLLQKAKDQLEVLREQANMTHQDLKRTQNWHDKLSPCRPGKSCRPGATANAVAAALVTWERRLLANKTILTLNLFVADLLFVSMIPLIVAVRWTVSWTLGYAACQTVLYVICVSGCVTITTLASISVERVQAILQLQTVPTLNPRMVTATLTFIWAFSAFTSIPLSVFFTVMEVDFPEQERVHICTLKWPDTTGEIVWNVAFTALCFLLPGLVIVVSYSKILQIIKSCRRRLQPRDSHSPVGDSLEYQVSRQDIKLFRTLLVLVLSFLIMWSPIFIITFLILARNFLGHPHISSTMFFWVVTFTLANSALNPILYSICQFKNNWRRVCCGSVVAPLREGPRASRRTQGMHP